jgi:hypothetical protein
MPLWRKSKRSTEVGNCVHIAILADGNVAFGDDKNPHVVLAFTRADAARFITSVKAGEFDLISFGMAHIH